MVGKLNSLMIVGLSLFIIGLVLPFMDIYIIKSVGKAAVSIGSIILFLSIALFIIGVVLTLLGIHKQNKFLKEQIAKI